MPIKENTLKWMIESKAGLVFGVYEAKTAEDAFQMMVEDSGGSSENTDGNPTEGTIDDWVVKPATNQEDA
jgi:hypothetical protein